MSETTATYTTDDQRITPLEHAVNRLESTTGEVDALREQLRSARAAQREALAALRVVNRQRHPQPGTRTGQR